MKKGLGIGVIAAVLMGSSIAAANENANPCGNNGNNCCTDDGGISYEGVPETCEVFCSSTAVAVNVAVSSCSATAAAACAQICSCTFEECKSWKFYRGKYGRVKKAVCLD